MNINGKPRLATDAAIIEMGSYRLLIGRESGRWVVLGGVAPGLLAALDGKKTVKEIVAEFSHYNGYGAIMSFLRTLYSNRLVWDVILPEGGGLDENIKISPAPYLAVLNMTESCNLACNYCYVDAGAGKGVSMSKETAIRIVHEMLSLHADTGRMVYILFHGGEPLLNFPVIRAVTEHFKSFKEQISLEIQTNAVLIDEEVAVFFKENDFHVGISLDGPEEINDLSRGKGSFARIEKGLNLLKKHEVRFGAIAVLNKHNHLEVVKIVDTFNSLGIRSFSLNPMFCGGRGGNAVSDVLTGDQLFSAYCKLLEKLAEVNAACTCRQEMIEERNIKYLARRIMFHDNSYMCMRTPCGAGVSTLGFDTNGDVYLCDDFLKQEEFLLGNVARSSLKDMLMGNEETLKLPYRYKKANGECPSCTWKGVCAGICPAHIYYAEKSGDNRIPECSFKKKMIPHIIEKYIGSLGIMSLIDRDSQMQEGKQYYFNINYTCNNRCIFCASDLTCPVGMEKKPAGQPAELNAETFASLLKLHDVKRGDSVIINGGEPTLSGSILEILQKVADRKGYSILFTNGRKLKEREFCMDIINSGVNRITIPLYGANGEDHDNLTSIRGSFAEVCEGIENIIDLRKETGSRVDLILKLLYVKPTLDKNPQILKWIAGKFPGVDIVSLNSLIVSDVVRKRGEELIPGRNELAASINATLDTAREENIEALVELWDIPFCLVDERNLGFITIPPGNRRREVDVYFDPGNIGGLKSADEMPLIPTECRGCVLLDYCKFVSRNYFDKQAALRSLGMIFPRYREDGAG